MIGDCTIIELAYNAQTVGRLGDGTQIPDHSRQLVGGLTLEAQPPNSILPLGADGLPLSAVGPRAPYQFVKAYFPEAEQIIRIASAYFTLSGYKLGRKHVAEAVQFRILVGKEDGRNVRLAVLDEIWDDLQRCDTDLWQTVDELVRKLKSGQLKIVDARAMEVPFHCKFYIVDDKAMWHGSANFSRQGLQVSIEQVALIRDPAQVAYFTRQYEDYFLHATDLVARLISILEAWLQLAPPFHVYLKTLLALNDLPDHAVRSGLGAHSPLYYQKGVIARALRQIDDWGGACIVAATGLGKTVIGAEIVSRLVVAGKARRLILITPKGVQSNWQSECQGRDLPYTYFNTSVLFKQAKADNHQAAELERQLEQADADTVIVIDEAHVYRNQLMAQRKRKQSLVYLRVNTAANERKAKVVLLTATAYGTNLQNLDSLLHLLPHSLTVSDLLSTHTSAWRASDPDSFARLPVVTVLGLPHVLNIARQRGDIDAQGRTFIQFGPERRYLPYKLQLMAVPYEPPLKENIADILNRGYFDQLHKFRQEYYDDDSRQFKPALIDTVYNSALDSWLSSPAAFRVSLAKNLATPDPELPAEAGVPLDLWGNLARDVPRAKRQRDGRKQHFGKNRYEGPLKLTADERLASLSQLAQQLEEIGPDQDDKLQQLLTILLRHCQAGGKVIIFVSLYHTAAYLLAAIQQRFPELRVGCTVEPGGAPKLKPGHQRRRILEEFSPRSHNVKVWDEEHDVLICSDADGIGVNLQDANTIVNYDPPEGADRLFQRAGRVLRMTSDPFRTVHLYTLVPSVLDGAAVSKVDESIHEIFQRATKRHDRSQRILGSSIHTNQREHVVKLDDEVEVELLIRDSEILNSLGGIPVTPSIAHTAVLEQYRALAEELPDNLLSAKRYAGLHRLIYVLVRHQKRPIPIVYNLSLRQLDEIDDLQVLDLLACTDNEPRAGIDAPKVERLANQAVRQWCQAVNANIEEVRKICALYLLPDQASDELMDTLEDAADDT